MGFVEESGEKWSIEHLDRWRRNVHGFKGPAPKPPNLISYILKPYISPGLYRQTFLLSNLYSLKTI